MFPSAVYIYNWLSDLIIFHKYIIYWVWYNLINCLVRQAIKHCLIEWQVLAHEVSFIRVDRHAQAQASSGQVSSAHASGASCTSAKAHCSHEWSFVCEQKLHLFHWACHLPGCQSGKIGDCCFNKAIPVFNLESTGH